MNKTEKKQRITDLKDRFSRSKVVVFTDYKGMSVAELTELRVKLREASLEYSIVKNTLAKIAAQDTHVAGAENVFDGPVGIAIGYDDPALIMKKLLEFAKTNEKLKVKSAVVEGRFCERDEIKEISELPSREVMLSMLVGVLQSPLSMTAGALSATVRSFANAMEALKNQKNN
ncbi:MAG: 50S ribosomal protein L10 [Nitrospirota bacterium]|nr:50S ribosomal protein L10 [Nitrospirota bacterium]